MQTNNSDVEPLFNLTATCPACERDFQTSRIRPRYKKAISMDSDFCPHYVDPSLNPDYYVVQVCEHCGCGTTEHALKQWSDWQHEEFNKRVSSQWQPRSYAGERSWKVALETYQLALLTAQTIKESHRVIAGLLHHIAWLYRYQGDEAQEQKYLRFALYAYLSVYERESQDLNDARLIFITGDLHRRLGEFSEAAKNFAHIIHDHRIMDAAMIRAAREQWMIMREEMKAQQLEIPDQLFNENKVKLT